MTVNNDMINAALEYAELGILVFPCLAKNIGDKKAKSPFTPNGFKNASADSEQVRSWWRKYPGAAIGMPAGRISGIVVVDVDPRNGGDYSLEALTGKFASLPDTLTCITGGGGTHYYFKYPDVDIKSTNGKIRPGIDIKSDGSYVILPPSGHQSGRDYFWDGGSEGPDFSAIADMPEWLIELINSQEPNQPPAADGNSIPEGCRNHALASLAGSMRRNGMTEQEISAAITVTNNNRCSPPLDEKEVAKIARSISRYRPDDVSVAIVEDHYSQFVEPEQDDPPGVPVELMRIPGFVSELMDFCTKTAPYPSQGLAFCGALAMQSFLCGRKVRDEGNLRTNIYLIALAGSASGKDWPRQVNAHVMMMTDELSALGDKFASGEGIQDALFITPSMLFQNDEIDGILRSATGAKDNRYESIITTMLTAYTGSGGIMPMRRKAGRESPGIIDQPHLTLFGTATPQYYYEALSERLLANGFFARLMVIDIGRRGKGQDAGLIDKMPSRIIETARWWKNYLPGNRTGNLLEYHPEPAVIEYTAKAKSVLRDYRQQSDQRYAEAESEADEAAKAIWGRANENARKLALLYASSVSRKKPVIDDNAADWATQFVDCLIKRMLYLASLHVADGEFDKQCKFIIRLIKNAKGRIPRRKLLKNSHMRARELDEIIETLMQREELAATNVYGQGRPGVIYILLQEKR